MKTLDLFHDHGMITQEIDGYAELVDIERDGLVFVKNEFTGAYMASRVERASKIDQIGAQCVIMDKAGQEWEGQVLNVEPLTLLVADDHVIKIDDPKSVTFSLPLANFQARDVVLNEGPGRAHYGVKAQWTGKHILQVGAKTILHTMAYIRMKVPIKVNLTLHSQALDEQQEGQTMMRAMVARPSQVERLSAGVISYPMGVVELSEETVLPVESQEIVPRFKLIHDVNTSRTTQTLSFETEKYVPSGDVEIFLDDRPLASRYLQDGMTVDVKGLPVKDVRCESQVKRTKAGGQVTEVISIKARGRKNEDVEVEIQYTIPYGLELESSSCGNEPDSRQLKWKLLLPKGLNGDSELECEIVYVRQEKKADY